MGKQDKLLIRVEKSSTLQRLTNLVKLDATCILADFAERASSVGVKIRFSSTANDSIPERLREMEYIVRFGK